MTSQKHDKRALIAIPDAPSMQPLFEPEAARLGYDITTFKDYDRAWDFFKQETPSLVILGSDGQISNTLELCRRIRKHPMGRFTTILMANARRRDGDEEEALDAGADHILCLSKKQGSLRALFSVLERQVTDRADLAICQKDLFSCRRELDDMNDQLEQALTNANQLAVDAELAYLELDQIFKTAAGGILVIDTRNKILRYNEGFLRATQMTAHDMEGKKCYEAFPTALCPTRDCPLKQILRGRMRAQHEVEKTREDGSKVFYMITSTPLRGPDADLIAAVTSIVDITPRVEAELALRKNEERFRALSIIDDLTKLYNKRHLNDRLKSEIDRTMRYDHPLSLMLMDIDDFKIYNDAYGHTQGDHVLAEMGKIISSNIRKSDSGFRYGGEEFVVILPETPVEAAEKVANRIRLNFSSTPFHPAKGQRIHKTISIGLTQFSPPEDEESLVARADQNMYRAKKSGKNRVVFS